ncbi:Predicted arabinose efflux permease, MFS family [Devosia sp. YR412]|uniref:MFS transporter n=1 Tax=Devosia sp. YR412 TaxID=1881030 RepID=UPI0008ADB87A|nr:MFS transporter [Devosia sp. YR412]SEP81490.1 Predicted arabinose efflux permease, MFS family [Devosia sp. YR412]
MVAPVSTASFRGLAWSSFLAHGSEQVLFTSLPLIAVLIAGADATGTGLLQVAQTLPYFLLALPLGVLADRTNRANLMATGQLLRVLGLACGIFLVMSGQLDLVALSIIGAFCAVGTLTFVIASPALLPSIVSRQDTPGANTWLELGRSIAMTAGPAAAGLLVARIGSAAGLALALGLSLTSAVIFVAIKEPASTHGRDSIRPFRGLVDGASIILHNGLLRWVVSVALVFNASAFALHAVLVVFLADILGASGTLVGSILGLLGTGMIVAALTAPVFHRALPMGIVMIIGPACGFLSAALMVLTYTTESWGFAAAGMLIFGFGPVLWTINSMSLMQAIVPRHQLGRVSGLMTLATFGVRPLGALLGTLAASVGGVGLCLMVVALGFAAQLLLAMLSPILSISKLDDVTETGRA